MPGDGWSAVGVPARSVPLHTPSATGAFPTARAGSPAPPPNRGWASGPGAPAFPRPQSVDQQSADAVALAGTRALVSADTIIDQRPQDTAVRAANAGWLMLAYAQAQFDASTSAPPGAQWDSWTRHRAYVVVTAHLSGDDHPPDTARVAVRKVLLTEQAVGRDGWHDVVKAYVIAVVLKKVNNEWRIDRELPS